MARSSAKTIISRYLTHLIHPKLNTNHWHYTKQSWCQPSIERTDTLLFQHSTKTVINSLVRYQIRIIHLRYQSSLDSIHWDHNAYGSGTGHTTHDGIFNVLGRSAMEHFGAGAFDLFKEGPCETLLYECCIRAKDMSILEDMISD